MDSKISFVTLFFSFNLFFFTFVSSGWYHNNLHVSLYVSAPKPKTNPNPNLNRNLNLNLNMNPNSNLNPSPSPSLSEESCPRDALKLGVCAKLLNGIVGIVIGNPPKKPCCSLLGGLLDIEAALCLCTAMKANILGININIPISLNLLMNICGKNLPSGFIC
ncbi:14 kda proline-rich protein dc2.15, partial [Nicotiana attenuata]